MQAIWNYIRRDEWSPYIAGILLGVVGILAFGLIAKYFPVFETENCLSAHFLASLTV